MKTVVYLLRKRNILSLCVLICLSAGGLLVRCKSKAPTPLQPKASFRLANKTCTAPCDPGITNLSRYGVSYRWDFGDGGTATDETPAHTYTKGGAYPIKLTVSGEQNATSDTTVTVTILRAAPTAAFTVQNNNCTASCQIVFQNQSQNANTYQWDFGDGGTATDANPQHTYTKGGTYPVKLTATGDPGKTASATQSVTIQSPVPVPAFLIQNDNCIVPCTVVLQNQSTNGTTYTWKILSGYANNAPLYRTTAEQSPSQAYSVAAPLASATTRLPYTAELTVTGPGGTKTLAKTITIRPPSPTPIFTYEVTRLASGTYIQLINQSRDATSYKWYYGNGLTSTLVTPPPYLYQGPHTVTLDAFNETSPGRRQLVIDLTPPSPILK